jgi:hypothetical protein
MASLRIPSAASYTMKYILFRFLEEVAQNKSAALVAIPQCGAGHVWGVSPIG